MGQEILIYVDDKEKHNASVAANFYADNSTRNRAYINTLGAELLKKYLKSENIDTSYTKNLHSIKKVLEEFDISDVMLSTMHIDVRVVFNENEIFVPKSHFEYNIVPDIYLVFLLSNDKSNVKFLGFFEPNLLNKNNHNDKYYFIEKEKLNSPSDLINYINSNKKSEDKNLSDDEIEKCQQIMISFADNDIDENEKKYLLNQLTKSSQLRDLFVEYENFEKLSFKVMNDSDIDKHVPNEVSIVDEFDAFNEDDFGSENTTADENLSEENFEEDIVEGNNFEENTENDSFDILDTASDLGSALAAGAGAAAVGGIIEAETAALGADIVGEGLDALENIDISFNENNPDDKENIETEDAILTETIDEVKTEALNDETLPNIEAVTTEEIPENEISLDNVEIMEPTENIDFSEEISGLDSIDEPIDDTNAETMSLDSVDEIEPIEDTNIDEETMSLDSVDEIEPIENANIDEETMSLDSVDEIEPIENANIDEETMSLDSVDEIEPIENANIDEETMSLDSVDEIEPIENANIDEETMSLDSVDEIEPIEDTNIDEETITLDDISEIQETGNIEAFSTDENAPEESINTEENSTPDFLDIENISQEAIVEDIPQDIPDDNLIENISQTDTTSEELSDEATIEENVQEDIITDNIIEEGLEQPEIQDESNYSEAFGKNLLENLSAEDIDNIELEETGSENTEVNSDELLSQIDDILSTSSQTETDQVAPPQDYVENILDNGYESVESPDKLNVLFNEEENTGFEQMQEPPSEEDTTEIPTAETPAEEVVVKKSNSKVIVAAAVLIAALAAGGAFMFLKPKNDNMADLEPMPNRTETVEQNTENILETNAPDVQKPAEQKPQQVQEIKNNQTKPIAKGASMSVRKIVWDVPDTLSYSTNFQNYLRTAGKSIKLSLGADLLLADEYAYTNQVKVGMVLSKEGSIQESRIVSSSGSTQIDNIVLRSVKDTLNVIKPPRDDVKAPNFNLNLIIYF